MKRYLRLVLYFLQFSFSKAMVFRLDFFFRIGMDIIYYAVNILFYRVIYTHTALIGGWSEEQMMIFVGAFLLIDAISMALFSNNLIKISYFINRGDLDYYLIRPVSSLFFLSVRDFAVDSFVNLIMAIGILAVALVRYNGQLSSGLVLLFIILLLIGTYLRYLVRLVTIIPVFWLQSNHGLEMMFFHCARLLERPDAIFSGWFRIVITTVLPFGLMASFPARILFDGFQWGIVLQLLGVTVVFNVFVLLFWHRGLRSYSSASS